MDEISKKLTFFRWLTFQHDRTDTIGNYAKIIIKSHKEKPVSSSYMEWYLFTKEIGTQSLLDNFIDAWEEFKDSQT